MPGIDLRIPRLRHHHHLPGPLCRAILPEQVHILNVSFLVPTLRREFGGCAGNIAYTLQALGGARW